jgi:hypothetical protein
MNAGLVGGEDGLDDEVDGNSWAFMFIHVFKNSDNVIF